MGHPLYVGAPMLRLTPNAESAGRTSGWVLRGFGSREFYSVLAAKQPNDMRSPTSPSWLTAVIRGRPAN